MNFVKAKSNIKESQPEYEAYMAALQMLLDVNAAAMAVLDNELNQPPTLSSLERLSELVMGAEKP